MKAKNAFLTLFVFIAFSTAAQIPNNGFEEWSVFGNGMIPNGWWCSNDSLPLTGTYYPVTRATGHSPGSSGNYSIRLECNPALSNWAAFGLAWTGGYYGSDKPAFPVNGHPIGLQGYYKYTPQNGTQLYISLYLYKNGLRFQGGSGAMVRGDTIVDWTPFTVFVEDTAYLLKADSATIIIQPFYFGISGSSVLYVDDLTLIDHVSAVANPSAESTQIRFSPCPASDIVTLDFPGANSACQQLIFYNLTGSVVKILTLEQFQNQFDVTDFDNGLYLVEIKTQDASQRQKLIVNKKN